MGAWCCGVHVAVVLRIECHRFSNLYGGFTYGQIDNWGRLLITTKTELDLHRLHHQAHLD